MKLRETLVAALLLGLGGNLFSKALSGGRIPTYDCNGKQNDNAIDRYLQIHRKHNLTFRFVGKIWHQSI